MMYYFKMMVCHFSSIKIIVPAKSCHPGVGLFTGAAGGRY
jgi:hypothetical protein